MQQNYRFSRFPSIGASHAAGRVWRECNTFSSTVKHFIMSCGQRHATRQTCRLSAFGLRYHHKFITSHRLRQFIKRSEHSRKLLSRCRCSFFSAWNVTENPNNFTRTFSFLFLYCIWIKNYAIYLLLIVCKLNGSLAAHMIFTWLTYKLSVRQSQRKSVRI